MNFLCYNNNNNNNNNILFSFYIYTINYSFVIYIEDDYFNTDSVINRVSDCFRCYLVTEGSPARRVFKKNDALAFPKRQFIQMTLITQN